MPCYDKKVESARKEFECKKYFLYKFFIESGNREIDTVLTTSEIMDLVKKVEMEKVSSI